MKNKATDAFSRHPTGPAPKSPLHLPDDLSSLECSAHPTIHDALMSLRLDTPTHAEADEDIQCAITAAVQSLHVISFQEIKEATNSDPSMQKLVALVEQGFKGVNKADMPPEIQNFYQFRSGLYLFEGVILYNVRKLNVKEM